MPAVLRVAREGGTLYAPSEDSSAGSTPVVTEAVEENGQEPQTMEQSKESA